jgi:hypothetical protein
VNVHCSALFAIALVHGALHVGRDVGRISAVRARPLGARSRGRGELLAFENREEGVARAVDHLGEVTRGIAVTHERLKALQLVAGLLRDRALEGEALGGNRLHVRGRPRGWGRNWIWIQLEHARRRGRRINRGDERRDIGLRCEPRDQHLQLRLAAVRGAGKDFVDVGIREMRREHHDAVTCKRPSAMASKICGYRRAARAARMRLYATSSARRSTRTQYTCIEGHAAGKNSSRASTSARCASSAAVVCRSVATSAARSASNVSSVTCVSAYECMTPHITTNFGLSESP